MKKVWLLNWCLILTLAQAPSFAQDAPAPVSAPETPAGEGTADAVVNEPTTAQKPPSREGAGKLNLNLDGRLLYGQYNNILTALSMIQNFNTFAYKLNWDFRRSNDFGYLNTSFYKNAVGFTSTANIASIWKLTPVLEIDNESHGMFNNSEFAREEKDKIILTLKNEVKKNPNRFEFSLGGGNYVHRLKSARTTEVDKTRFYSINGDFAWELIWSASNTFRMSYNALHYFYEGENVNDDTSVHAQWDLSFKVTEYSIWDFGVGFNWNRDMGRWDQKVAFWKADISAVEIKYTSIELSYTHDLVPFRPEDFYFEQKFIDPTYDLPPAEVHKLVFKAGFDIKFTGDKKFYVKRYKLGGTGTFEKNDAFYNYVVRFPMTERLLSADTLHVMSGRAEAETGLEFGILGDYSLELGIKYDYAYYDALANITYRPSHALGALLRLSIQRWEFLWENTWASQVYVDPASNRTLDDVILGTLSLQFRIIDSFNAVIRMDNLYNSRFNYREGYPEPGFVITGGIRVII